MSKLLGIFKYISPSRTVGANQRNASTRIAKLRKLNRRMRATTRSAQSLDPVISQKLENARKS